MDINIPFSRRISVFNGKQAPEEGMLVGYAAIIQAFNLKLPYPTCLTLVSEKHKQYDRTGWKVLTARHLPNDHLIDHLKLALKYEGINLLFFKKLFENLDPRIIEDWVNAEPQSKYTQKIWFLYEWLMRKQLDLQDLKTGNYDPLIAEDLQFGNRSYLKSPRHRIYNNLPGTVDFCPLIHKTESLTDYINQEMDTQVVQLMERVHHDLLLRTSSFLLLKDSQASFYIEKENPPPSRASRWGRAIGEAGQNELTHDELLRLQQIIIEDRRFVKLGYRTEGGFVGEHDRQTGQPIPDHISARPEDLTSLMNGLLTTIRNLEADSGYASTGFYPVLSAAMIAFGFVFIHPFVDGNGRLHRYLIHHVLSKMRFTPRGIIFPVSAAILERLDEYRQLLESYSHPLLDCIEWKETDDHNVDILNDTVDYYRYFDATPFAEFLFSCIQDTLTTIIPHEVKYLQQFDEMSHWLKARFDMPDKTIAMLVRFLEQNNGSLSKRAREKEFSALTEEEVLEIERKFVDVIK